MRRFATGLGNWWRRSHFPLVMRLTHSAKIARRYFVVNGFDGALTMLGILVGFYHAELATLTSTPLPVVISACLGAAIALGSSGLSSAYLSESAEQRVALRELEQAMVTDLVDSAHGRAARWATWLVAVVNGLSPFLISLLIISPLWLPAAAHSLLPISAMELAMGISLVIIFLLGIFLGVLSGRFWLVSGLRTLLIAGVTGAIIILATPGGINPAT